MEAFHPLFYFSMLKYTATIYFICIGFDDCFFYITIGCDKKLNYSVLYIGPTIFSNRSADLSLGKSNSTLLP